MKPPRGHVDGRGFFEKESPPTVAVSSPLSGKPRPALAAGIAAIPNNTAFHLLKVRSEWIDITDFEAFLNKAFARPCQQFLKYAFASTSQTV